MGRRVLHTFPEDIFKNLPRTGKNSTPQHALRLKKRHPVLRGFVLLMLSVVLFVGTSFGLMYSELQSNIDSQEVDELLGTDRPTREAPSIQPRRPAYSTPLDPFAGQDVNILVLGSDVRNDESAGAGNVEGMRADTTLLVHVSSDRSHADVVSIPRDSWVGIPSCTRNDGSISNPQTSKFNAAFAVGGANGDVASAAACAIKTVESLTGVFVDAYAVVDFTGFENIVDALGGVNMCIPTTIDSPKAQLYLEPGMQLLDGQTALGYARARSGEGLTGSDIARIDRQQELFGAIADKAIDSMTDIPTLYDFLRAVTKTLTASPNIAGLNNAAGLAWSLRGLDTIDFHTVPIVDRGDGANVLWTNEADDMWAKIQMDEPVSEPEPTQPASPSLEPSEEPENPSSGETSAPAPSPEESASPPC